MMKYAVNYDGPIAVRYPRGTAYEGLESFRAPIEYATSEVIYRENGIALVAVGSMIPTAEEVRDTLKDEGRNCTLVNARFVKPIDEDMLYELSRDHSVIVTMEENVGSGGYGEKVREYLDRIGYEGKVICVYIPDEFVEHGNVDALKKEIGIDAESILARIEG